MTFCQIRFGASCSNSRFKKTLCVKETFVRSHDGDVDNIVLKARLSPMSSSLVEDVDVGGEKDDKEKDTDLPLVLMMG